MPQPFIHPEFAGTEQLKALVEQHAEDEIFENSFGALRRLMKLINRLAGKHQEMDVDRQTRYFQKIAEYAQELGFEISTELTHTYMDKLAAIDEESKVRALLMLLKTNGETEQTSDHYKELNDDRGEC